jgi:LacI family repressor for deo operon, udp, cdd, tsx, nupC, and nupG
VNSRRADGLILVTSVDQQALLAGMRRLPPMILALDVTAGAELPTVRVDHAAAAAQATDYLIGLGHRRIAHIAGAAASAMTIHRLEGFQRALEQRGVPVDPLLCAQGAFTVESGEQAMNEILARTAPPTAVFAANDEMAVGAIRALRRAGLSVPQDVSVLGFDDQRIAALYEPALTTVRIPTYEIGYRSMIELSRSLAGEPVDADVILPCQLIVRDSARALVATDA